MGDILVTVKTGKVEIDLKLSGKRPVEILLRELSEALKIGIPATARIQAEPVGRILNNQQCLLEQGVYNGSILTIM
jgi:uncharacterized ubiquitin-like protein YukD